MTAARPPTDARSAAEGAEAPVRADQPPAAGRALAGAVAPDHRQAAMAHARACFLRACWLDVAVRKPGNVSIASPGHGMQAAQFLASAQAAAGPLFEPGLRVGARIEAAVQATWAAVGCNTNLGIVLLCAPIALALEQQPQASTPAALRAALHAVLAGLDLDDTRAAYRAIARAQPGGLGTAEAQDVHAVPTIGLQHAMALAADRDLIARQYRDGFADVVALAFAWPGAPYIGSRGVVRVLHGTSDTSGTSDTTAMRTWGAAPASGASPAPAHPAPDPATAAAVQRLYLAWLGRFADSHIVRKHGERVAHTVMTAAQGWQARAEGGAVLDADPGFAAWDASLKAAGHNPGTSADLTVAALLLQGWLGAGDAPAHAAAGRWHGS